MTERCEQARILVVDDSIAFCGGSDFTRNRWDTQQHLPVDQRRRTADGRLFGPRHDVEIAVDGAAAAALGEAVDYRLRQVMSTPGGLSIVLPPRPVREGDWVAAIPVDGHNLVATAGAEDNLALEPGDTVMVPRRVNTVMVLGAVPRSGAVPFVEGRTTDYYLNESGGVREDGALNRMVVVHANGAVEPIARDTVLTPGDVVVVPTRHIVRTVRTESELQTWLRTIVPLAIAALVF